MSSTAVARQPSEHGTSAWELRGRGNGERERNTDRSKSWGWRSTERRRRGRAVTGSRDIGSVRHRSDAHRRLPAAGREAKPREERRRTPRIFESGCRSSRMGCRTSAEGDSFCSQPLLQGDRFLAGNFSQHLSRSQSQHSSPSLSFAVTEHACRYRGAANFWKRSLTPRGVGRRSAGLRCAQRSTRAAAAAGPGPGVREGAPARPAAPERTDGLHPERGGERARR